MAENQKSIDGIIEKLALIANGLEELFPEGTIAVALELKNDEFKKVQNNFRTIDHTHKQFKIDLSGVEFMFLLNESSTDDVSNS
jgi:hypothetical protein